MSLRPLVLVLVPATAILAAPRAHAEDQLAMGVIKLELKLPAENGGDFTLPTAQYLKRYFNQARCVCDDTAPQEYQITYSWATRPTGTPIATAVDAWAG